MVKNVMLMVQEEHFIRDKKGNVYATRILNNSLLERYAKNFERIIIFARFDNDNKHNIDDAKKITLDNIEFCEISDFRGPKEMLFKFPEIVKKFRSCLFKVDVVYFRTPSLISLALYRFVPKNKFIGIEFMMGAEYIIEKNNLLFRYLNKVINNEAKQLANRANATLYVTKKMLQESYPPNKRALLESEEKYFTIGVSDVQLTEENFYIRPDIEETKKKFTLICVGFMDTYRKGQHILIEAVSKLLEKGYDINLILIGDGKKRLEFEKLAKKFHVDEYVTFTGKLTEAGKINQYLKSSDIFVLPSTLEGLPRVIIEAMATGLPVIASDVNGNAELVNEKLLVKSFEVKSYIEKIELLINDINFYNEMSKENYYVATKYNHDTLDEKRNEFYKKMGMIKL